MNLVFVSHLFLDSLFLFNLVNISVFPATLAQLDGPWANIFSVQLLDGASEVWRVLEADETVPGKQVSQFHSKISSEPCSPFRLVASLVADNSGFLETRESRKCPRQNLKFKRY